MALTAVRQLIVTLKGQSGDQRVLVDALGLHRLSN